MSASKVRKAALFLVACVCIFIAGTFLFQKFHLQTHPHDYTQFFCLQTLLGLAYGLLIGTDLLFGDTRHPRLNPWNWIPLVMIAMTLCIGLLSHMGLFNPFHFSNPKALDIPFIYLSALLLGYFAASLFTGRLASQWKAFWQELIGIVLLVGMLWLMAVIKRYKDYQLSGVVNGLVLPVTGTYNPLLFPLSLLLGLLVGLHALVPSMFREGHWRFDSHRLIVLVPMIAAIGYQYAIRHSVASFRLFVYMNPANWYCLNVFAGYSLLRCVSKHLDAGDSSNEI